MPLITRTSRAEADAVAIWRYIAQDNAEAATELLHKIDERIELLSRVPKTAPLIPEIHPDIRKSSVGNYAIFYRCVPEGIQVIRILHGARKPEDLL